MRRDQGPSRPVHHITWTAAVKRPVAKLEKQRMQQEQAIDFPWPLDASQPLASVPSAWWLDSRSQTEIVSDGVGRPGLVALARPMGGEAGAPLGPLSGQREPHRHIFVRQLAFVSFAIHDRKMLHMANGTNNCEQLFQTLFYKCSEKAQTEDFATLAEPSTNS